jgi:hypothetical protein
MTGNSMGLAKSEAEWAERASIFLKTKLKEKEVTYVDLVRRLKKHGFTETCGFRFIPAGYSEREAGHRSDLKPAAIPINFRPGF